MALRSSPAPCPTITPRTNRSPRGRDDWHGLETELLFTVERRGEDVMTYVHRMIERGIQEGIRKARREAELTRRENEL